MKDFSQQYGNLETVVEGLESAGAKLFVRYMKDKLNGKEVPFLALGNYKAVHGAKKRIEATGIKVAHSRQEGILCLILLYNKRQEERWEELQSGNSRYGLYCYGYSKAEREREKEARDSGYEYWISNKGNLVRRSLYTHTEVVNYLR